MNANKRLDLPLQNISTKEGREKAYAILKVLGVTAPLPLTFDFDYRTFEMRLLAFTKSKEPALTELPCGNAAGCYFAAQIGDEGVLAVAFENMPGYFPIRFAALSYNAAVGLAGELNKNANVTDEDFFRIMTSTSETL